MSCDAKPYSIGQRLGYLIPLLLAVEMSLAFQLTRWVIPNLMGAEAPDLMRWMHAIASQDWLTISWPLLLIVGFVWHYHRSEQRTMTGLLWLAVGNTMVLLWCLIEVFAVAMAFTLIGGTVS